MTKDNVSNFGVLRTELCTRLVVLEEVFLGAHLSCHDGQQNSQRHQDRFTMGMTRTAITFYGDTLFLDSKSKEIIVGIPYAWLRD